MSEAPAKIRINQKEGTIEVEGSEEFVLKILQEHRELFISTKADKTTFPKKGRKLKKSESLEVRPKRKRQSPTIEAIDVDLSAGEGYPSLKDFYNEKKPKSFLEKTTLFTYYLTEYKGIDEVSPGHLLTCYRGVNSKLPKNIPQTILDAKNDKGWLTADSSSSVAKISNLGINLVEHELPRNKND